MAGQIEELCQPEHDISNRLVGCADVHVLSAGRIVKSGGKDLALELEKKGYSWIESGAQPVGA